MPDPSTLYLDHVSTASHHRAPSPASDTERDTAMTFNMLPRRYTPESLIADSRQARRSVANVLATVPASPGDRRKLGEFMRAHPGQAARPGRRAHRPAGGHALLELADAMEGKPVAAQGPLDGSPASGERG